MEIRDIWNFVKPSLIKIAFTIALCQVMIIPFAFGFAACLLGECKEGQLFFTCCSPPMLNIAVFTVKYIKLFVVFAYLIACPFDYLYKRQERATRYK